MTFPRALITAGMAAGFSHYAGDGGSQAVIAAIGWAAWAIFASDPLPAAIERGLDAYRRKHQR
jgi:hypothetical protein